MPVQLKYFNKYLIIFHFNYKELVETQVTPKEYPSGVLDLSLVKPNGNYDYLEITVELISTNSKDYYINKELVTNCQVKSKQTFRIFKNDSKILNPIINDLCMLSVYNVSTQTVLKGYDTVKYSSEFQTGNFYFSLK